ncbi:MAG: phosphoribosylaminoimidazolesuccinocarboxamide synthase, partial [Streptosporangiales bacterium]|nr:phosphoribosylaminoimidazolesuccinocarboxamide synthase [Streptosporangiales bacterium]
FAQLPDVPNHVISATDVPAEFAGRALRCRRLSMVPFELIARGYLAGSGLAEYRRTGAVSGVPLPPDLVEGDRLAEPIFTPTTKAPSGHDRPATLADMADALGRETAEELRDRTLEVYRRGARIAAERGVVIADTKLEFGTDADGRLVLADEVLTSDSSRFWPAEKWEPGRPQYAMDKQVVRDWAASTGWDKTAPGPDIPPEIVAATQQRYAEVYARITGDQWTFS